MLNTMHKPCDLQEKKMRSEIAQSANANHFAETSVPITVLLYNGRCCAVLMCQLKG